MSFNRGTIFRILPVLVSVSGGAPRARTERQLRHRTRHGHRSLRRGDSGCNRASDQRRSAGLNRTVPTDATGQFVFSNIPFNPYRITVTANGFALLSQNVEIRSVVGTNLKLVLQVAGGSQTVTVEASGDLVEDRSHLPHRRGSRPVHQSAAGERSPPRSARWSRSPPPAWRPTPTASSTVSATTPPTPFPSTASRSPISRARFSPTSFLPSRFNRSKSSAARHRPNTAARPAW